MSSCKINVIDNLIYSQLSGELDVRLANEWVEELEKQESQSGVITRRIHDVRNIDAVQVSFDDMWAIAQRRLNAYQFINESLTVFWVSTPLNYGVSRMYQSLTDGTPFKIEVFYTLQEIADYLDVDIKRLQKITS